MRFDDCPHGWRLVLGVLFGGLVHSFDNFAGDLQTKTKAT